MRTNKNYTIDYATSTITITKRFGRLASQFGTAEFVEMKRLREEYTGFRFAYKVIRTNKKKNTYGGLTIAEMTRFMETKPAGEMSIFIKVVALAKERKGTYAIVKKWFLDNYKDEYNSEVERLNRELNAIEEELKEAEPAEIKEAVTAEMEELGEVA